MVVKSSQLFLGQGLVASLDLATTVLVSGLCYGQWPLHCSRDALCRGRVEYLVYELLTLGGKKPLITIGLR